MDLLPGKVLPGKGSPWLTTSTDDILLVVFFFLCSSVCVCVCACVVQLCVIPMHVWVCICLEQLPVSAWNFHYLPTSQALIRKPAVWYLTGRCFVV